MKERYLGCYRFSSSPCWLALAAAPQAPPPVQSDKDYIIGPEDVLEIQVWGNKDLNQMVFVTAGRPDVAAAGG